MCQCQVTCMSHVTSSIPLTKNYRHYYQRRCPSNSKKKTKGGDSKNPLENQIFFVYALTTTPYTLLRPSLRPNAVDLLNLRKSNGQRR